MIRFETCVEEGVSFEELVDEKVQQSHKLVIYNDDVNTFDHVIESLVEVCEHSYEQAEQCSLMIHYKGKYAVKNGDLKKLRPQKDALCERAINAVIEE